MISAKGARGPAKLLVAGATAGTGGGTPPAAGTALAGAAEWISTLPVEGKALLGTGATVTTGLVLNESVEALQRTLGDLASWSSGDAGKNGKSNENTNITKETRGTLTGKLDGLTTSEKAMVNDLLNDGNDVEIIPRSNIPGNKTPDFLVNGIKTEQKTLTGKSMNTPVTKIQDGFKQGAEKVIIDRRGTGLTFWMMQIR